MSTYWQSHFNERVDEVGETDFFRQVGKTFLGEPVPPSHLERIVDDLQAQLELDNDLRVLDLGCGNGLVTSRVAPRVRRIVGVDYAERLVHVARRHHGGPNVSYAHADVLSWSSDERFDAAYLYEVVQHIAPADLPRLASVLSAHLVNGARALLCGVPDRERRWDYYDTPEKRSYAEAMDEAGTPHMGHWYTARELAAPFEAVGFRPTILPQDPSMHTAHYRFNLRLDQSRQSR